MNNPIKQIRQQIGMPRKIFAETLDVTYGAIANYELGTREPEISIGYRIIDLAKKYKIKVNLEDIYTRKEVLKKVHD